jgi:uncharacterized MAPEG superfamily protein
MFQTGEIEMITWLLLGTGLYVATLFIPSLFLISKIGVGSYLGSRDADPVVNPVHGRAQRVVRNFGESYPPFAVLGILSLIVADADIAMATTGAMIFVIARVAYVPLYLAAVPVLRSGAYLVGLAGVVMIALSLL